MINKEMRAFDMDLMEGHEKRDLKTYIKTGKISKDLQELFYYIDIYKYKILKVGCNDG